MLNRNATERERAHVVLLHDLLSLAEFLGLVFLFWTVEDFRLSSLLSAVWLARQYGRSGRPPRADLAKAGPNGCSLGKRDHTHFSVGTAKPRKCQ